MLEIVGTLIFILNDIGFIYTKSAPSWLALDYGGRIIVLGMIAYKLKNGSLSLERLGIQKLDFHTYVTYTFFMTLIGLFLILYIEDLIYSGGFLKFPEIKNQALFLFDLTFGITLVALSEELLFRGLIYNRLKKHKILLSSILFGLIHWGAGLDAVVIAIPIGMMFAYSYKDSGSILPALSAHFLIDFFLFSGLI